MSLRDRIGIDVGRRLRLEEALEWAAEHEVRWIDIQLDAGANALSSFDDARAAGAVPHGTLFTVAQDARDDAGPHNYREIVGMSD